MRLLLCFLLFFNTLAHAQSPYVLVLGVTQDGGYPQAGCNTPNCLDAWEGRRPPLYVTSLAIVDPQSQQRWLIDATPDFKYQLQLLKTHTKNTSNDLTGIFLTHAHMGHYTGLMHLGREALGAKNVKVYAMPLMQRFLENNGPWSQLVSLKNIDLHPMTDSTWIVLNERIKIQPFTVPHRAEYSETVGFRFRTNNKTFVYIPDIDKWSLWKKDLNDVVRAADYAFIDATFFADGEIPRPMSEVPHPFVSETMKSLEKLPPSERQKVYFTHFNHTNPLLRPETKEFIQTAKEGYKVAKQGQVIEL